jgi:hypothetical protein
MKNNVVNLTKDSKRLASHFLGSLGGIYDAARRDILPLNPSQLLLSECEINTLC